MNNVLGPSESDIILRVLQSVDFFVNNTNMTFLSFLYKISIEVSKNKVASSGT